MLLAVVPFACVVRSSRYVEPVALSVRTADEPTIRLLDGLLLGWVALWLVVGVLSGVTMWHLSELGDTVSNSGSAIGSAGRALESLGDIPVIGDRPAEVGRETSEAGADIEGRGVQVKGQLRQLSILLGLSITLIPITPVAGLYLPLRVSRRREVKNLRRALRDHPGDEGLDLYLASRALNMLPYNEVHRFVEGSEDPHSTDAVRRTRRLADAELARLGLTDARG